MTLEDMENKAKLEADGTYNKKLGNYWLEVHYRHKRFYYYWGVNEIPRKDAEKYFLIYNRC